MNRGPRLIRLGLIGVNADFKDVYVPIFLKYLQRIQVTRVFDLRSQLCKSAARDMQSKSTCSLMQAVADERIDGLICLRPGWYHAQLARLADQQNKPLLDFSGAIPPKISNDVSWNSVTPALLARYQPAMMRLRELMSTQLGIAEGIELWISADTNTIDQHHLSDLLDWGMSILGRDVQGVVPNSDASVAAISINRTRPVPGMVELVVHHKKTEEAKPLARIVCQKGIAEIRSVREIAWRVVDGEEKIELHEDERRPEEVIIDHFCRRLAGGLIPVPEWKDRVQASTLASHVRDCLRLSEGV